MTPGNRALERIISEDPALDRCGTSAICHCDPYRARVLIERQADGSAIVSCPTCRATFTMPPLVGGGQGRNAPDEGMIRAIRTMLIIYLIILTALLIAVMLT